MNSSSPNVRPVKARFAAAAGRAFRKATCSTAESVPRRAIRCFAEILASSPAVRTMTSVSTPNSASTRRSMAVATAAGERFVLPRTTLPLCRCVTTSVNPASVSATRRSPIGTRLTRPRLMARRKATKITAPSSRRPSGCEVGCRRPCRPAAALGLLPLFLPAQGGEVEEVVGAAGGLEAAGVLRVRVEHTAVGLEEAAPARQLERLVRLEEVRPHGLVLGPRAVVVLVRRDRLVDRDPEVVVEIGPERRVPGDVPTLLRLPPLQLLQRRARHHGVAGVADVQVLEEAG